MAHARQRLGSLGEQAAVRFLEGLGYEIVEQNWHSGRYSEIDIVARHSRALVFIEVKTRSGRGFGNPEDAVTQVKQHKLRQAAESYKLAHPHIAGEPRFEVVAVLADSAGEVKEVRHFTNLVFG